MNKYILSVALVFLLACAACGDKRKEQRDALEKDYAALFEKDYAAFEKSPEYKQFEERYNELCALSDKIYLSDSLPLVDEKLPGEKLCFMGENDAEWDMEMKRDDDYINNIIKVYPYSEYINNNKDINAVIVSSEFCRGLEGSGLASASFEMEEKYHNAYNALNKEKFLEKCREMDTLPSYIYDQFCKARLNMDALLRAKYMLVLQEILYTPWEYDNTVSTTFNSGLYIGRVYIYNVADKKMQYKFFVLAMNSESVESLENTMQIELKNDLLRNIETDLQHNLDSLVGVKNKIPGLYMSLLKR